MSKIRTYELNIAFNSPTSGYRTVVDKDSYAESKQLNLLIATGLVYRLPIGAWNMLQIKDIYGVNVSEINRLMFLSLKVDGQQRKITNVGVYNSSASINEWQFYPDIPGQSRPAKNVDYPDMPVITARVNLVKNCITLAVKGEHSYMPGFTSESESRGYIYFTK